MPTLLLRSWAVYPPVIAGSSSSLNSLQMEIQGTTNKEPQQQQTITNNNHQLHLPGSSIMDWACSYASFAHDRITVRPNHSDITWANNYRGFKTDPFDICEQILAGTWACWLMVHSTEKQSLSTPGLREQRFSQSGRGNMGITCGGSCHPLIV